jgi:RNA polymerase sigma factor (sigma-70 family)
VAFAAGRGALDAVVVEEGARDGAAFADWVRPHLPALSAVAVRQVGADDAADVVQDALVRAWRRWGTYSAVRGSARVWLVAIVLDQARRHRLRHLRLRRVETAAVPVGEDGRSLSDRLSVESALGCLSRRQRQVVVLFYLADLSVTEVGVLLGISAGSVKTHLHDARARLRTVLEEQ